jgi:hypothetical protein
LEEIIFNTKVRQTRRATMSKHGYMPARITRRANRELPLASALPHNPHNNTLLSDHRLPFLPPRCLRPAAPGELTAAEVGCPPAGGGAGGGGARGTGGAESGSPIRGICPCGAATRRPPALSASVRRPPSGLRRTCPSPPPFIPNMSPPRNEGRMLYS